MTAHPAPETAEALAEAILRHITSVTNLPDWMQVPALGHDMRPLAEGIVAALLDSGVLDAVKAEARAEVVRAIEADLDDADQVTDSLERPNYIAVWGVRRTLLPFGGEPHRWPVPAEFCAECGHYAYAHDDEGEEGCAWTDCDCLLSEREAQWGRDEEMDDAIQSALWEDAVARDEPWTRAARPTGTAPDSGAAT